MEQENKVLNEKPSSEQNFTTDYELVSKKTNNIYLIVIGFIVFVLILSLIALYFLGFLNF